jgi:hypothetical protein
MYDFSNDTDILPEDLFYKVLYLPSDARFPISVGKMPVIRLSNNERRATIKGQTERKMNRVSFSCRIKLNKKQHHLKSDLT